MKEQDIHGAISAIMEGLKGEGKSPKTLKSYETSFNSFEDYLKGNGIKFVDESMCLEYIHLKTGQRFNSFACVTSNTRVDYRMRPLSLLLYYLENGHFCNKVRSTTPTFICPPTFEAEYEAFCEELVYRGHRKATIESNIQKTQLLIMYLFAQGVTSPENITIQHIECYLKTLEGYAVKYIGTFLYVFRNFFSFLYDRGYIKQDLASMLPKIRTPRNASVPLCLV